MAGPNIFRVFIEKYAGWAFMAAVVILVIKWDFFSPSPWVIAGQVVGVILMVSSRIQFAKKQFRTEAYAGEGPLIRRGPYRVIRHPIYAGALLLTWASILGHWSIFNAAMGLVVLVIVLLRISSEEKFLQAEYSDYAEYARHTKRLVPFVY